MTSPIDYTKDSRSALESKEYAQWIAFAPSVFQASRVLCESGILSSIEKAGNDGLTMDEIVSEVRLSNYAVRVLLEAGLGIGLVLENEDRYRLTKTAWFLLHDPLTQANLNFTHHVNYRGFYNLEEAIRSGKPEGLKTLGNWSTIYEGLRDLPDVPRRAWFNFDHHYSEAAFPDALPHVFAHNPKRLLDIGGNTGKWAIACARYNPEIKITIMDLPGQLAMAKKAVTEAGFTDRVDFVEANLLDPQQKIPEGFDAVWMSQFLDCFSEAEIVSIMSRCRSALNPGGLVHILEPFWDRQNYKTAAFCLQQISLYFTAMANGNSQMYRSTVFEKCVEAAEFRIKIAKDNLGVGSTLFSCEVIGPQK